MMTGSRSERAFSVFFHALNHKIRRRLVYSLKEGPKTFTQLLEIAGVSSSHLTYHISSLDGLIYRNDNVYKLSVSGENAWDIMMKIERPYENKKQNTVNPVTLIFLGGFLTLLMITALSTLASNYQVGTQLVKQVFLDSLFITSILTYPILPLSYLTHSG